MTAQLLDDLRSNRATAARCPFVRLDGCAVRRWLALDGAWLLGTLTRGPGLRPLRWYLLVDVPEGFARAEVPHGTVSALLLAASMARAPVGHSPAR